MKCPGKSLSSKSKMPYNEDEIDELILLIRDSFMLAFTVLKDTLVKKLEEAESDWM